VVLKMEISGFYPEGAQAFPTAVHFGNCLEKLT
jgi:hypothetical protein